MLPITASTLQFYLYLPATDMRKSFDGLCGVVREAMTRNPLSGDVYVFVNRRRDRIKLLLWERGGLDLLQALGKRLFSAAAKRTAA